MDLKMKGINWVGNIYQKLEAICQEVDNLVRQDSVKHVESQVHTGCESMKSICSDVVQELLPPSVRPVEHEAESVPLKQNDENRKYTKSLTIMEENLVDGDVKELPVDLDVIQPVENAWTDGLFLSELPLVVEPMPELSIEQEKFNLSLGENDNVPGDENPDVGVTGDVKKEKPSSCQFWGLYSVPEKYLCDPSLPNESVDEDHENTRVILSEVSPGCSVHEKGLQFPQKLGTTFSNFVEADCTSDPTNLLPSSKQVLSVETCKNRAPSYFLHDEGFESLEKSGTSCSDLENRYDCASHSSNNLLLAETYDSKSPLCSVSGDGSHSPQKSGTTCRDEIDSVSEQVFSVGTCERKSPACSSFGEPFQSPEKLGTSYRNSTDEINCASDPLNPLELDEQVLSIETCEIREPSCSVHGEALESPEKLGTSCSYPADETEYASTPLNSLISTEQVLSVEVCKSKSPTCSVRKLGRDYGNSANKTDQVFDSLNSLLSTEQILSVEICEHKAHSEGLESLEKLGTSCSNTSDECNCVSDLSNSSLSAKQNISVETCENNALSSSGHGDAFQSHENLGTTSSNFSGTTDCVSYPSKPLSFAEKALSVETCENNAPACLVNDPVFHLSKKLGAACSDPEKEIASSFDSLSTHFPSEHSCENKVANMKLVCSSNSLATKGRYLSKVSQANFPIREQKISNLVGDALCVPDMPCNLPSLNSAPSVLCLNVSSEAGCTSPCGGKSNGLDTSEFIDTVPQCGSTANKCDQSWESAQLEAFISFGLGQSDVAGDDISGMDTIELSDKMEQEDCSLFVDNKELYAISRKLQKLRSYKKIIQDAFTSKKRRAKEYEQLAIWYGDVNVESSQDTQNLILASMSEQAHLTKLPTDDSCDSEWELL